MIIGIDLDDILFDLNNSLFNWHNKLYGTSHTRKDARTYYVETVWGVTQEEAIQRVNEFYNAEAHFETLPIAGAIEAINYLKENNTLFIITARPESHSEITLKWLDTHFPNVFQGVYFSNHFATEYSKRKKSEVCKELGVEVFIEDALHNAEDVADAGIPVLLLDTPWNQGELKPLITRVYSWEEIVEKIIN